MSEWFDNQKVSRGNFWLILQEHIDKTSPRRNLTAEEAKSLTNEADVADVLRKVREAADLWELDELIEKQSQFGRRVTQKNK